jgi:carboxypeptidase Taq
LEDLRPHEESLPYDSDEASLIRVARKDYEKARRVPNDLQAEMTRTAALTMNVWVEARKKADYSLFLPHLQKTIELKSYVECFDTTDSVYDPLLDDFERDEDGASQARFDDLGDLIPLWPPSPGG